MRRSLFINQEIVKYIEDNVLSIYQTFDKGHDEKHVNNVIKKSLELAGNYDVNINMVYIIAAYHDLGLKIDRKLHHVYSGEMLMNDHEITKYFTKTELQIMKEAIEDHRASNKNPPRSIYGCIIAEADREIDYERIMYRCLEYRRDKDFDNFDILFEEVYDHMTNKYGENGYLKLWLDVNFEELDQLRLKLKNKEMMKKDCYEVYLKIFGK